MARLQPLPIDAIPELADSWKVYLKALGFVPNSVLILQRKPKLVKALAAMAAAVWDPEGEVPVSLKRLIGNLVDNALRYTPKGGRVDVEVMLDQTGATLSVSDTGPGIPAEHRARVFDRFYRVPGTRESGSGLGLAIASSIAGAHLARIALEDGPRGGLVANVKFDQIVAA